MNRIKVTDDGGRFVGWFDADKAERFGEGTDFDGSNHISVNTGSQWHHEELYRTAQGRWVGGVYNDYQGSLPNYRYVDDDEVRTWLIRNDHDGAVKRYFDEVEEERGPGRPPIEDGVATNVKFPASLLARIDSRAATEGVSRAEMVRRLCEVSLLDQRVARHPAELLPAPKGYLCAAGCLHGIAAHREHGCDVRDCDCPAPFGRVLPADPPPSE